MKTKLIPVALAALAVVVAGCGRSDNDGDAVAATPAPAPVATAAPATAPPTTAAESPPGAAIAAKVGETDLGEVLASTDGLTLYGFTNDVDAQSTCFGTCAEAWPPVIVDEDWNVGPGLDTGIFATTVRDDGSLQLVAGKWPLYTFSGDAAPGDTTGQGSGDVWFAVDTQGKLIAADAPAADSKEEAAPGTTTEGSYGADPYAPAAPEPATSDAPDAPDAATAPVSVGSTGLGNVLVDRDGFTLYGFTNDTDGVPTCEGDCAGAWPPVVAESEELPEGLDPAVFSVVHRADDTHQLKAGKWPLYRFAGDANPGETNGQGSGDVWFVVDPAGGLIKNAG